MLRGCWHIVLAIGLIAISSFALGQTDEQPQEPEREAQREQGPTQITPIPLPIEIIESDAETDARERHEAEARQRNIEDLAAQQGMNEATQAMNRATQRMADYSWWTTLFVGGGTVLVFASLILMWGANRAAVAAIKVTRKMGQRQMRAYVNFPLIETITLTDQLRENKRRKVHGYYFKITVENAGNTPAVDCIVYSEYSFVDVEGFQSPAFNKTEGGRVPTAIGPHSMVYGKSHNISREDAQRVLEGKARLFLWWRAEYRDVFDGSQKRFVEKSWEVLIPVNPAVVEPGDPLPAFSFMAFERQILN